MVDELHEQHAAARERVLELRMMLSVFGAASSTIDPTEADRARQAAMQRELRQAEHAAALLELSLAEAGTC
jgi:hypothetical protein